MKPQPVPVTEARTIARTYGHDQVIILVQTRVEAPDEDRRDTHQCVTTFGADRPLSQEAAAFGEYVKRELLGWEHQDPGGEDYVSIPPGTGMLSGKPGVGLFPDPRGGPGDFVAWHPDHGVMGVVYIRHGRPPAAVPTWTKEPIRGPALRELLWRLYEAASLK